MAFVFSLNQLLPVPLLTKVHVFWWHHVIKLRMIQLLALMLETDVYGLQNQKQEQQLILANVIHIHVLPINNRIREFVLISILLIINLNKFVYLKVQIVKKKIQVLSLNNYAIQLQDTHILGTQQLLSVEYVQRYNKIIVITQPLIQIQQLQITQMTQATFLVSQP